ncbi:MAG: [FeFe] hydrogenase H-cluster radical SAM maturase HydE [Lachnospiraceae bacterium]
MKELIDKLRTEHRLSRDEYIALITNRTPQTTEYLFENVRAVRKAAYGTTVYLRGLIEFTNHCDNNCYYCGIRKGNAQIKRYRLDKAEILQCCRQGYQLGFRTFVLQGGEDHYYSDALLTEIISQIRREFPDCAITLSIGEKDYASYQAYFEAGADRYLLRHETADEAHYKKLHPAAMSLAHRKECLFQLKEIGYQVGTGFMVGSPYQTAEHLAQDMLFITQLQPHMVGIGPYIPQQDTPFRAEKAGTLELTLFMLGLLRLALPAALLPATTALGTIDPKGRELGIKAGANVVMPNLSPQGVRDLYLLYDNKICTGDEAAQCRSCIGRRIESIGYAVEETRGDHLTFANAE